MIEFNSKCFLKCLYSIVSFESDIRMKDPCIIREISIGIHDIVNDQGFTMHYRAISNTVSHFEISDVREAKGMD